MLVQENDSRKTLRDEQEFRMRAKDEGRPNNKYEEYSATVEKLFGT